MSAAQHLPSRSSFHLLRGLRYHVRHWGDEAAPPLFMLHGWMDVGASFQFIVDHLQQDWHVMAPDWRGFGRTEWSNADCYWFPDYLADLESLLDVLAPAQSIHLVGHSMGGVVALLYAGVRPQRVSSVVNLDGLGLKDIPSSQAPVRYAQWLDELKAGPRLRDYANLEQVAERLKQTNPRLTLERAAFLAQHWSFEEAGRFHIAGDPAHKLVNPVLYRESELRACWQQVICPVLWVEAELSDALQWAGARAEVDARRSVLAQLQVQTIANAGHMLHHDQPLLAAQLIEKFIASLS